MDLSNTLGPEEADARQYLPGRVAMFVGRGLF